MKFIDNADLGDEDPFARCAARPVRHTEQGLWQLMRTNLPAVHWARIENSVSTGLCDLNGAKNSRECWIELKVFTGNKLHFRATQPAWINQRVQVGGNVYILARNLDRLILYEGRQLRRLIEARVATVDGSPIRGRADATVIEDAALFITQKPFDWSRLEAVLFPFSRPQTK
jgi:hypothetical protein